MDTKDAIEMLKAARQRLKDARDAVDKATDEVRETRQAIALALGPFKIGDRVQRAGDKKIYEIVRADIMVVADEDVYAEFYGYPIKTDGTVSVRNEKYISNALDEKWHLVSLPQ